MSQHLTEPVTGSSLSGTQKRTLTVLTVSQVLSGVGLSAGVTVGALLFQDMLGSTALAGLPSGLLTAGTAIAAIGVGRLSQSRGRRPGLAGGYVAGAVGSAGIIAGAVLESAVLMVVALFLYGAGAAANLQARYAGADLATPAHRARAVSTVLVATTLGGVAGATLAAPTGVLASALGLPPLTGLFLISGVAYALAAVVLAGWLRPDPFLLARTLPPDEQATATATATEHGLGVPQGILVMLLAQIVMIAIMTMTPIHLLGHGHGTGASGLVIALHVGAMFLPSPLSGILVDRYGRRAIAVAAAVTLAAAAVLAAMAPDDSVALLALALILLGLGWNFGMVSGTAIITDAAPVATRAKTQGMADVAIAIGGAAGGMSSGFIVVGIGYPALALLGGLIALAIIPVVLGRLRTGGGS
ncbi:MFS transporter [Amycolatopsis sp. NPDC051071]|uniref:MFS transporter n=1 Tax=Amycolatopsis sp. NPDC051071 TaxID=3154637 RepID=UPI003427D7AA